MTNLNWIVAEVSYQTYVFFTEKKKSSVVPLNKNMIYILCVNLNAVSLVYMCSLNFTAKQCKTVCVMKDKVYSLDNIIGYYRTRHQARKTLNFNMKDL